MMIMGMLGDGSLAYLLIKLSKTGIRSMEAPAVFML